MKSLVYLERAINAEERGNVEGANFCLRMAIRFDLRERYGIYVLDINDNIEIANAIKATKIK